MSCSCALAQTVLQHRKQVRNTTQITDSLYEVSVHYSNVHYAKRCNYRCSTDTAYTAYYKQRTAVSW
eukprot:18697-Heterococcus_DN1.PRE.1